MPQELPSVDFACPRCRSALEVVSPDQFRCPADGLTFDRIDGIWRFLLPEREAHYSRFLAEYETVRKAEGRGGSSPDYYRALPHRDLSGRFSGDWKIRARSFRALVWEVVAPLERRFERPLIVLDLGAGIGWLSARLAVRHARALAVDLLVNPQDGLGAWQNYQNEFTPLQAEFSRLPLAAAQADLVLYNASFHYAEDYEAVLTEALRVLRSPGWVVVMDTPVYQDPASGAAMVREREAEFTSRYGFASDALASENFITYERMAELGDSLGIRWQHLVPNYGLRWRLRRWLASRRGRREPAEFGLWIGARLE